MTTTITRRVSARPVGAKSARVPSEPTGTEHTPRIQHFLLLEGDAQVSGTDCLLLEGDMQSGTDKLKLEGDASTQIGGTVTKRVPEAVA